MNLSRLMVVLALSCALGCTSKNAAVSGDTGAVTDPTNGTPSGSWTTTDSTTPTGSTNTTTTDSGSTCFLAGPVVQTTTRGFVPMTAGTYTGGTSGTGTGGTGTATGTGGTGGTTGTGGSSGGTGGTGTGGSSSGTGGTGTGGSSGGGGTTGSSGGSSGGSGGSSGGSGGSGGSSGGSGGSSGGSGGSSGGSGGSSGGGNGSSGGPPCFAGDVRVATPSGPRAIRELQQGDQVLSLDVTTGRQVTRRIGKVHTARGTTAMAEISWLGGRLEGVTANHPLFDPNTGGWVTPSDLKVGQRIEVQGRAGLRRTVTVLSVAIDDEAEHEVFNLDLERDGDTFFAEGVLAFGVRAPVLAGV